MPRSTFDFTSPAGHRLSGVLETGTVTPRAYAIFTHCFTCDKTSLAATRVSRALAEAGIAVLRFDFTGLGASEGDFGRGLSGDVADLAAAAGAMAAAGMPVQLLVGHSFGGAAVIAAAGALPEVRAVVTIGAPSSAEHVLHQLSADLDAVPDGARVPVSIGGRPFELGRAFIEDIRAQNQSARIAALGRALLVLHSPVDAIVGIANASDIFLAARHPKSFVSLDTADHLLRRKSDSDYAAAVIAAWATRYLDMAVPEVQAAGVRVSETRAGKFQVRVTTPAGSFLADEPVSVGGLGSGPSPYDLLGAALGACTAMTCRLYAERKALPLDQVTVTVDHVAKTAAAPDRFVRTIRFDGPLDDDVTRRLFEIADRCPVHRTLSEGAVVETRAEMLAPPGEEADHGAAMLDTCAAADRAEADGAGPSA